MESQPQNTELSRLIILIKYFWFIFSLYRDSWPINLEDDNILNVSEKLPVNHIHLT